jgi:hypothetical protein
MPWRAARRALESKTAGWLIVTLLVASLAANIVIPLQVRSAHECLARWADAYTARTERVLHSADSLNAAQTVRDDALDALVRAIPTRDRARFARALTAYLRASDGYARARAAYRGQVAANPVPAPPKLRCN